MNYNLEPNIDGSNRSYLNDSWQVYKRLQVRIYILVLISCFPFNYLQLVTNTNNIETILIESFIGSLFVKLYLISAISFLIGCLFNNCGEKTRISLYRILRNIGNIWGKIVWTIIVMFFNNFKIIPFVIPTIMLKDIYSYEAIEYSKSFLTKAKKIDSTFIISLSLSYIALYLSTGIIKIFLPFRTGIAVSFLCDLLLAYVAIVSTIIFVNITKAAPAKAKTYFKPGTATNEGTLEWGKDSDDWASHCKRAGKGCILVTETPDGDVETKATKLSGGYAISITLGDLKFKNASTNEIIPVNLSEFVFKAEYGCYCEITECAEFPELVGKSILLDNVQEYPVTKVINLYISN